MSGLKPSGASTQMSEARSYYPPSEVFTFSGCTIVARAVNGAVAREIFLHCRPTAGLDGAGFQAEAIYRAIESWLEMAKTDSRSIVRETVFHRNLTLNLEAVRAARERVRQGVTDLVCESCLTEIEQPPIDAGASLEVSVEVVLPVGNQTAVAPIHAELACSCDECCSASGVLIQSSETNRFYSGALYGRGENAYDQTLAMFEAAEKLLQQAGMEFSDVVRTWLYLPEMERDYGELNKARRLFFKERNIDPIPASTGIGAGLVPQGHDLCLVVYAVKQGQPLNRTVMTTPTLNEAPQYGADFSRGMRVVESNKEALYVSGTASLNEEGKSVHAADFDAQVDRMLVNVAALLEAQGAGYADIAYAYTYVKHPKDANRLIEKFEEAGYTGFANAVVVAPVCRPELLCETEAVAVVKKTP